MSCSEYACLEWARILDYIVLFVWCPSSNFSISSSMWVIWVIWVSESLPSISAKHLWSLVTRLLCHLHMFRSASGNKFASNRELTSGNMPYTYAKRDRFCAGILDGRRNLRISHTSPKIEIIATNVWATLSLILIDQENKMIDSVKVPLVVSECTRSTVKVWDLCSI